MDMDLIYNNSSHFWDLWFLLPTSPQESECKNGGRKGTPEWELSLSQYPRNQMGSGIEVDMSTPRIVGGQITPAFLN